MRLAILAAALARGGRACTTVLVAPGATRDGGTIVSHNADCFNCDFRFGKVEPRLSTDPYSVFRYRPTFPHEVSTRSNSWRASALDPDLPQRDFWGSVAWRDAQLLRTFGSLDDALDEAGVQPDAARGAPEFAFLDSLYGTYTHTRRRRLSPARSR